MTPQILQELERIVQYFETKKSSKCHALQARFSGPIGPAVFDAAKESGCMYTPFEDGDGYTMLMLNGTTRQLRDFVSVLQVRMQPLNG